MGNRMIFGHSIYYVVFKYFGFTRIKFNIYVFVTAYIALIYILL